LEWNTEVFDLFDGTYECSEIFDITAPEGIDISKIKCSATKVGEKVKIKITCVAGSIID
jgi:hypothetical protein